MFYYLNGTVAHIEQNLAVIDVAGAGYACRTSLYSMANLTVGAQAKLYTYLHVREDISNCTVFVSRRSLIALKCFWESRVSVQKLHSQFSRQ